MQKLLTLLLVLLCLCSCKEKKIGALPELHTAIKPAIQEKPIDPAIDNLIEGKDGTRVFIPANSLVFEDGTKATGEITVQLEEYLTAADFFSRKLSTVSGNRLLETGGMINITAMAGGKKLRVSKTDVIVVAFPGKSQLEGMETFYGDTVGNTVNWIATSQIMQEAPLQLDSSIRGADIMENKVSVCGWSASVNESEIKWRLKHPDSTIFTYVRNNNHLIDSFTKRVLCDSEELIEMALTLDKSSGKITDVKFDEGPVAARPGIMKFLKALPPFELSSMESRDVHIESYMLQLCCHPTIDPLKYSARFEQKYSAYKDRALKAINRKELTFYVLTSKQLGWINCDRFLQDPSPKTDFIVSAKGVNDPQIMLVFEEINSVMQPDTTGGQFVFHNLPEGKKVKIIGTAEQNGTAILAVQSTRTGKTPFNLEGFNPFSLNEFKERINQ